MIDRSRVYPPPVLCPLGRESAAELSVIESESDHPSWDEKIFSSQFDVPAARAYGARLYGSIVAFVFIQMVVDEAHILNIGVRRNMRGLGFGRAILKHALSELHHQGVRWVSLEVRRSNRIALHLYESIGFQEIGLRPSYYRDNGEDALVLRASISGTS